MSLLLVLPAWAAPVTLNLKDADINALVESMSVLTGKNFIVDPRVKGRVTIISSKSMDEKELYEVFLAVLGVHGFAAIPGDKVIKIVPAAGAKQENVPTVDQQRRIEPDQIVTRVIQVQNVSAAQIVPILRPLIPPQGHLAAYTPTNVLIISDSAANVERIASIISRIDLASNEEVEIVALRHASATEIVRVLTALEQGKTRADPAAGAGSPLRMVADERTNSILLSGDKTSRVRLRTLITHLDTPVDAGGNTQVVYLRYAKAKDLMTVLQGVSKSLSNDAARNAPIPGQPGAPPGGSSSSSSSGGSLVDIQADESTNALVITAPPELIRSLRSVIAQLDVRRAQVLVEAVIAEISAEKTAELGVQWVAAGNSVIGFTNLGTETTSLANIIGLAAQADSGDLTALSAARIPQGMQMAAGDFSGNNRFGALISALAKDADTNVLSTPTVVTMDNEEAEIVVGQNVPFVTGSYTSSTSSGSSGNTNALANPFQTIQRDDVGIKLKVKPQINEGNAVKLEIEQEVSSVVPSANAATQGPTTNKRSIKTIVMVEDGQVLVLGGLIDDKLDESAQKVPLLGDVPLLGNLFRYRSTTKLKRNLMVFLHPVILRDPTQGTLHTSDKYSYIRQQQLMARENADYLLPNVQSPVLKPQQEVKEQRTILDLSPPVPPEPAPPKSAPPPAAEPADIGFNNR
ncbi:MAG TPA: type II secretion system secretin GspD [Candidatus Competibacteraceae bacterium]|nr:type II secretion system secretin GspD [Candidatus Competibacteraceae bacterium]HRZ04875.1 type II secretion system secretin GspD [Candidatus Competibacteraceae bacterium]HSA46544.1 type II secretion system secretin GspD [Candidatus Competibacteraceae bacterium]